MKKFLLRSAVFLITFFVTLVVASRILNKDQDNMTMEMAEATLPTLSMVCENMEYNRLFGYVTPMDCASQRDSITILGEERNVDFLIDLYGRQITRIGAQLRSVDGERLVEAVELQGEDRGEKTLVHLSLKDLIERDQEYLLTIQLQLDGWQQVYFYTRAIWNPDTPLAEDLRYVQDFHDRLYRREAAKELIKYLESNSRLEDNSSFHKVNIHSSFQQITWGDLKVRETLPPVYTLKEINRQACSLVADYQVAVAGDGEESYYRMREYFRVRYTADRMYLLDYERTMTQIPQEDRLYGGDKLLLGIADDEVDMLENEDGSVVAFQQSDCLYAYRSSAQKLTRVFRFYDEDVTSVRDGHDECDIKILRVDEAGNIDFAVYGYMNRGVHEGEVGIRICEYDANVNIIREIAFLPWKKPFSDLKAQVDRLLYLNGEDMLYLYLDQAVYQVELSDGTVTRLMEAAWDGSMQVSGDHQILVWQEKAENGSLGEMYVKNLETGSDTVIRGGFGESLKLLGFMEQDIIYGVAREAQILRTAGGPAVFPMYKVCIAKPDGAVVKEYAQENIYVTACRVEENQIILERMEQKEDGTFQEISLDHVTRTANPVARKNEVSLVDIDIYKRYVQIKVSGKIDSKTVQLLKPKEVVLEGDHSLKLDTSIPAEQYRVLGPYGVEGLFLSAGNAVNLAGEKSGVVLSSQGEVVWQKETMVTRNQIMAIQEPEKVDASESLAVCLDTMLAIRGITVDSGQLLAGGRTALQIMENLTTMSPADMTNCSLDAMLYFVARDIPVLAILQSGEGILITGFNESQVVIFAPAEGRLYKRGKTDAAKWLEENGNCFLTFFP